MVNLLPLVTIGVCVRNGELTLRDAIIGIINQDYSHRLMEVIFVDDGSEDNTPLIIQRYISRMDMHVKVFRTQWKGLGSARNIVVENAKGKHIVWVDADMRLPSNHVRKQVNFMEKNPRAGIAKAKHGIGSISLVAFLEDVPFMVRDSSEITDLKLPGTGGSVYRVLAVRQVGGFDVRLRGAGEDQDVAYRIKKAGWLITRSTAVFYEARVQTWKKLWNKYLWYGYSNYDLYNKNRKIFSLCRMNPIASFIAGVLYAFNGYRLTKRKCAILLPFHFTLKMVAWFFGFTKAHVNYLLKNH